MNGDVAYFADVSAFGQNRCIYVWSFKKWLGPGASLVI